MGEITHIDLTDYGFTEEMANAVGKAVAESVGLADHERTIPSIMYAIGRQTRNEAMHA